MYYEYSWVTFFRLIVSLKYVVSVDSTLFANWTQIHQIVSATKMWTWRLKSKRYLVLFAEWPEKEMSVMSFLKMYSYNG